MARQLLERGLISEVGNYHLVKPALLRLLFGIADTTVVKCPVLTSLSHCQAGLGAKAGTRPVEIRSEVNFLSD